LLAARGPGVLFTVFWFAMNFAALKWWNATPGKKLLGLKVVRHPSGAPIEDRDRARRSAATLLSGYVFGIGYLWVFFNKERRGWHDLLAGTMVVAE
ncbi:MAG: RDD family protein, partial [Elusimicrobia bacterium]|nr:RDD family protein [Elusimicrobiota bacterium]